MYRSRSPGKVVGVLALLALAALVPPAGGQFGASAFCPEGDGATTPPASDADRPYLDLAPVDVRMRMTPTGATQGVPATLHGVHHVFDKEGTLAVTVEAANLGTEDPPSGSVTKVRVTLARAGGTAEAKTATIDTPRIGTNQTTTLTFIVPAARYTVTVEVNPDRSPAERCTDAAPNNACPSGTGIPAPCTETYYANNLRTDGLLVDARPDVMVRGISTSGPARATTGPSPDSDARITVELQNVGPTAAFNHSRTDPANAPLQVRIEVPGCACTASLVEVAALAPGEVREVFTTLRLRGLSSTFRAEVTVDPFDRMADASAANDVHSEVFRIPTAEVHARLDIDLPFDGEVYVLPAGRPLEFGVNVTNTGDAPAKSSIGGDMRTVVQRNVEALFRHDARFTLAPGDSAAFRVREDTANLTGTVTYRVRVDPGDEVQEADETNNTILFKVALAEYSAAFEVKAADASTTVPPGVVGKVPFVLRNTGTVRETFRFPPATETVRYADAQGRTVAEATIAAGEVFKGQFEERIPANATKGQVLAATLRAESASSTAVATRAVTFTVGDDTVPPSLSLEDPPSGFLRANQVVLRIVDNVDVALAEVETGGAFAPVEPDEPGGTLYTIDVGGRPASFRLNVRATDSAGNVAVKGFDLVRDTTAPRVNKVDFTPNQGVVAGSLVHIIVEASDQNMDRVVAVAFQPRPGGAYRAEFPVPRQGDNFVLRDWKVPERPGHYVFNVTAYDKAGNKASYYTRLSVQGLDIRLLTDIPTPTTRTPVEGQRVGLRYVLENTSPTYETGNFTVQLTLDFDRVIGIDRFSLRPQERRVVDFAWRAATPGPHTFSFAIDTGQEVAEDNEPDLFEPNNKPGNNVRHITTEQIFGKGYPLFKENATSTQGDFFAQVAKHWYFGPLALVVAGLFTVAFLLGRRTGGL